MHILKAISPSSTIADNLYDEIYALSQQKEIINLQYQDDQYSLSHQGAMIPQTHDPSVLPTEGLSSRPE
jgi:hypothetical protein